MWTRRSRKAVANLAAALFLLPATAHAACSGADLIPELRAENPEAVNGMYARAAVVPNGEGRFWKIEREGLAPSYMLGSFHAPEAMDTVTPEMWAAFDAADRVVVEVDLDQQAAMEARMASDPSFTFDLQGPGLRARLDPAQQEVISAALAARGMSLRDVDKMRPWLLASLLGFPVCHLRAMASGAEAMDVAMAQAAVGRGATLTGLEGYEATIEAFRRVGPDILLDSIASTGEIAGREEDLFRTNLELYAKGQIAAISEFGILLGERMAPELDHRAISNAMLASILDARNRAWMAPLTKALAGGSAFVLVGALHLPGDVGLVSLLRAEGFEVTRLDG